jgi:hypothetical protein
MNKETLRMQMLAGIITESEYKARLNEDELKTLKQVIQQEYPEVIQSGEIETGTDDWIVLLKLSLANINKDFSGFFTDVDEYDLFVNGKYEPYYDMITDIINESIFEVTDLKSLLEEMDTSDLIDAVAEAMGGKSTDVSDMQKAKNALLAYGVNELDVSDDFPYADNLRQALEELGVEII